MRAGCRPLMISLVGLSCATLKGTGLRGPSGASRTAPPPTGYAAVKAEVVATATLGALTATKWRLGNGLEIILLPDPAATSVSYMTWFRVGSRHEDEPAGQTGLAHLFEHLMFTQTKGQPAGAFDQGIESAGGSANAMTYYDFTAYMDDVPPEALATTVELEADRMMNLDLRKKQVDNERDVVVEERLFSVEDSVDGWLDELLHKQAFRTHPYRWPVIGWMKDIKASTPETAVAFYRRFYAPNNAVLVVTGRFEVSAVLSLIAARYAGLAPSADLPTDQTQPERAPAAEVRTVIERPVPADRFVVALPAPSLGGADRAAYEVLSELLLEGPSSRLYRALVVEKEMASSVSGHVEQTKDPGLYAIWVQMTKGHAAEEAEAVLMDELGRLVKTTVPAAELQKAKARLETGFWQQLSSSHGRAELLGNFDIACGDFRRLFQRAGEYNQVTAADVQRVAAAYFASGARSVVIARPRGGSPAAP
ncbi:MAG TPA: pitrilysin family protein [Polyangia bacterium]|jgi:zinc protease|nr:pitrilysin family protein [Polyangia bacterium]